MLGPFRGVRAGRTPIKEHECDKVIGMLRRRTSSMSVMRLEAEESKADQVQTPLGVADLVEKTRRQTATTSLRRRKGSERCELTLGSARSIVVHERGMRQCM